MNDDDDTVADSELNHFSSLPPSELVARSRKADALSKRQATACLYGLIAGIISTGVALYQLLTPNELLSCLGIMSKGAAVGVSAAFLAPVLLLYKFRNFLDEYSLRDNLRFALPAFALTCLVFAICGAFIAVFGLSEVFDKVPLESKIFATCVVAACMAVAGLVGYLVSAERTAN